MKNVKNNLIFLYKIKCHLGGFQFNSVAKMENEHLKGYFHSILGDLSPGPLTGREPGGARLDAFVHRTDNNQPKTAKTADNERIFSELTLQKDIPSDI